ncbi:hypothetical protein H9636_11690 [Ureibacillus sp. Re31]|uniref:Uncharacterized protein n=1 Tax=Ureibacillus galli TaxID=2762222 RepID=A0ABR8XDK0_9BACL|nr:hypothetical protein [Ureibacillus galli]MBD8027317.1 hypothetical protein [Ureibacillus galli]
MKKVFGLCFILAAILVMFIQSEMKWNVKEKGIEEVLSDSLFEDAATKFGLHAMGVSMEEQILTVRIDNVQHKEDTYDYFKEQLDSNGIADYRVEVFVDQIDL